MTALLFERHTRATNPEQPIDIQTSGRRRHRIEPIKRIDQRDDAAADEWRLTTSPSTPSSVPWNAPRQLGRPLRDSQPPPNAASTSAMPVAATTAVSAALPVGERVVEFAGLQQRLESLNRNRTHVIRFIFATLRGSIGRSDKRRSTGESWALQPATCSSWRT